MARDIKKFINPLFLKTIDLALMRQLLSRHYDSGAVQKSFDGADAVVRKALSTFFGKPIVEWQVGLVADLHRIAELGTNDGMQVILNEARRLGVALFPDREKHSGVSAPIKHDAKHVALYAYLYHRHVFEAAADFQALRAPTAMAEFRGPQRDINADLTEKSVAIFKAAIVALFASDLQGEYCRIGRYEEDGEINLVISHGAPVVTTSIVEGDKEKIITLRAVKYAVLRYAANEGLLRIGGVSKAQQIEVATAFAKHILKRPSFFAGKDARDLYTLDPIATFGPDFTFRHAFDERILEVRIVAAAADFFAEDEEGAWQCVRSWESKDASGGALRHFKASEVRFGRAWGLGEITFRVFIKSYGSRPAKVTVRLKPPGTLAFRRTRFEKAIHALVARNGLEKDRDADLVVEAAE